MAYGPSTGVVNGQRFSFPTDYAYDPMAYGPQTQGVVNVSPTMPPFIGGNAAGGLAAVNGYGTADNNALVATIAGQHPWNWKVSPVIWVLVGLIGSILLLQKIHWRKTILEGEERISLGGEREEARVEV